MDDNLRAAIVQQKDIKPRAEIVISYPLTLGRHSGQVLI